MSNMDNLLRQIFPQYLQPAQQQQQLGDPQQQPLQHPQPPMHWMPQTGHHLPSFSFPSTAPGVMPSTSLQQQQQSTAASNLHKQASPLQSRETASYSQLYYDGDFSNTTTSSPHQRAYDKAPHQKPSANDNVSSRSSSGVSLKYHPYQQQQPQPPLYQQQDKSQHSAQKYPPNNKNLQSYPNNNNNKKRQQEKLNRNSNASNPNHPTYRGNQQQRRDSVSSNRSGQPYAKYTRQSDEVADGMRSHSSDAPVNQESKVDAAFQQAQADAAALESQLPVVDEMPVESAPASKAAEEKSVLLDRLVEKLASLKEGSTAKTAAPSEPVDAVAATPSNVYPVSSTTTTSTVIPSTSAEPVEPVATSSASKLELLKQQLQSMQTLLLEEEDSFYALESRLDENNKTCLAVAKSIDDIHKKLESFYHLLAKNQEILIENQKSMANLSKEGGIRSASLLERRKSISEVSFQISQLENQERLNAVLVDKSTGESTCAIGSTVVQNAEDLEIQELASGKTEQPIEEITRVATMNLSAPMPPVTIDPAAAFQAYQAWMLFMSTFNSQK